MRQFHNFKSVAQRRQKTFHKLFVCEPNLANYMEKAFWKQLSRKCKNKNGHIKMVKLVKKGNKNINETKSLACQHKELKELRQKL